MTRNEAGGSGTWQARAHRTLDLVEAVYERLDALSRELFDSVEHGEVEDMLDLLDRRSELIGGLEALAGDYESTVADIARASSEVPEPGRTQLARRLQAIDALAGRITHRDEDTSRALDRRKASMGTELSEMGQKSAAVTAYSPDKGHTPAPRFQDREG